MAVLNYGHKYFVMGPIEGMGRKTMWFFLMIKHVSFVFSVFFPVEILMQLISICGLLFVVGNL